MKPGITYESPLKSKAKLPERPQRMPTKLTRMTTAFIRPMVNPTVSPVNRFRSSAMRWSGLSGGASASLEKRASSSW
ncbi:hypothetical protein D3C72_2503830 [compost metagenome]